MFLAREMSTKSVTLCSLPEEVLFTIFNFLSADDLVKARVVCSRFRAVIDSPRNAALWAFVPFVGLWPSQENLWIFEKAANFKNVEAMLKLAVAYLYCEGVPECAGKGTVDSVNGARATEWLLKAEATCRDTPPFSWILIRPPWAPHGICCKACVHFKLKEIVDNEHECTSRYPFLVGKTLTFHEDDQKNAAPLYYQIGMKQQCPFATFEYLKHCNPNMKCLSVESLRMLRQMTLPSSLAECWDAKMALCSAYADGDYGGISERAALQFVQDVMVSSVPFHDGKVHSGIKPNMRYILIDWLFEVLEMKDFPSGTMHLAVYLVDKFLEYRPVARSELQLLGISTMLLAARCMGLQIITIREAAWLTDNTYKYEQVVQMMGEIFAVFRGNIRKPTLLDYVEILLQFTKGTGLSHNMAMYLSEFSLLHPVLLAYQPSQLAAAIVMLSTIIADLNSCSFILERLTGFSVHTLLDLCLTIHEKCFHEKWIVKDHRDVELHAIVQRFSDSKFMGVSKMNVLPIDELKSHFGLDEDLAIQESQHFASLSTDVISVENLSLSEAESDKENVTKSSHLCYTKSESGFFDYTPQAMDCDLCNSLPGGSNVVMVLPKSSSTPKSAAQQSSSPVLREPLQSLSNHLVTNSNNKNKKSRNSFRF